MFPSLSVIGVALSIILLYFNARRNMSSVYLGVFFLLVSICGFNQYVLLYSKSVILVTIFLVVIPISGSLMYLIGPMLYWYIRSILTDDYRLKKKELWHLLPSVIYLISSAPYFFTACSYKVDIAKAIVNDAGFLQEYKFTFLSGIFSVHAVYLSRPLFVLGYTLWSIGLFLRFLMRKRQSLVFSRQHFMTKWLTVLLGFQFTLIVSHFLLMLKPLSVFFTLNILQILSGAGLTGLLISPVFFPGILYGLPQLPQSGFALDSGKGEPRPLPEEKKAPVPGFECEYLLSISQLADCCMRELKPFLQPDFNLTQFSVLIHIPVHHLTYYFREERKQHFNEYRNEWRINYAKNLIKEGKANELTLETIGLLSGFLTRNTFLTTFKKVEGVSPSAFAANIKN